MYYSHGWRSVQWLKVWRVGEDEQLSVWFFTQTCERTIPDRTTEKFFCVSFGLKLFNSCCFLLLAEFTPESRNGSGWICGLSVQQWKILTRFWLMCSMHLMRSLWLTGPSVRERTKHLKCGWDNPVRFWRFCPTRVFLYSGSFNLDKVENNILVELWFNSDFRSLWPLMWSLKTPCF